MTKRMTKLISILLICVLLLSNTAQITQAQTVDDLNKKAAQIEKENKEREKRIAELQSDSTQQEAFISEVNTQVAQIEAQTYAYIDLIKAKEMSVDEILSEIERTEERIAQKKLQIEAFEAKNKENIERYGQIAANMYMNSGFDAISLLIGSTSFFDMFVRVEMLINIGKKNTEFLEALLTAIQEQEDAIIALENEQAALEEQKQIYETELLQLIGEKAAASEEVSRQYGVLRDLTTGLDELQDDINGIKKQIDATAEELESIDRQIAAIIKAQQTSPDNTDRPDYSADGLIWPLDRKWSEITCYFGCSMNSPCSKCPEGWRSIPHNGADIGNSGIDGASIFAMQSGTVISVGGLGAYGNCVIIDHGGGLSTLYAHMSSIAVSNGQTVSQGAVIGYVGNTGKSTGPHLHFEVRVNGSAVNPLAYVQ